jgi:hypothetical protein
MERLCEWKYKYICPLRRAYRNTWTATLAGRNEQSVRRAVLSSRARYVIIQYASALVLVAGAEAEKRIISVHHHSVLPDCSRGRLYNRQLL